MPRARTSRPCWRSSRGGEEGEAQGGEGGRAPADEPSMKAQVLVMWGNTLFEHSQMRARPSKEWKGILDEAVVKFKEASARRRT